MDTTIREKSLFDHKEKYFHSVVYTIHASDIKSAHTHVMCFVWGYGVNVNHMITLESLESI